MSADRNIALGGSYRRNPVLSVVEPHVWSSDESLSDVLTALGYKHDGGDVHVIRRGDREYFSTTRTNAYELCVLWLLRTRQIALTSAMERAVNGYRRYGLGAEVDAALAGPVST